MTDAREISWKAAEVGRPGEAGAVATIALAIAVGRLSAASGAGEPPAEAAHSIALAGLFAIPGLVGWLGARSGRDALLLGAAGACTVQAFVAFSTLVFLVPALLFLVVLNGLPASAVPREPEPGRQWSPRRLARLAIAVALAVPIALLVVRLTGLLGVLALVAVAGAAVLFRRAAAIGWSPRRALAGSVVTAGVVALHVGAFVALFGSAEEVCWIRRVDGSVDRIPVTRSLTLGPSDVAAGCDGGRFTGDGILRAATALSGEVALAGLAALSSRSGRSP